MKGFLKKIFWFAFLFVLYSTVNYSLNSYFIHSGNYFKSARIVIMGDSHTQTAINPVLFDSAINISQSAEPYVVTYWKLLELVHRVKIDTLVLGFSYHNISGYNDKKFIDKKWAKMLFERTYSIGNFKAINKKIEIDRVALLKERFINMCIYPRRIHDNFIGYYKELEQGNLLDHEMVTKAHFYYDNKNAGISEISIEYLDSIINTCAENQIELFLAKTPLQKNYISNIPLNIFNRFEKEKEQLKDRGIKIIEMENERFGKEEFYNSDHLNFSGAIKYSKKLNYNLSNYHSLKNSNEN